MARLPFVSLGIVFAVFATAAPAATTGEYLMKAGAGDLYEKRSSEIVLQSSKDANLRKFATMMVTDHTKSTNMVKAAAMKSGVKPKPPMLDAKQTKMVADLTKAKGADRDHMYVEQQKIAHKEALALHQDYAASGNAAALKHTASEIVPVVQHHIEMLSAM